MSTIDHLISERTHIKELIHNDDINEQQIRYLQRKIYNIDYEIEQLCSPHEWGEPSYGYVKCDVCEKLRNTKHS